MTQGHRGEQVGGQMGPLVGVTISGRYIPEVLVGQGGMSDVYRARDLQSSRQVAIKLVRGTDPALAQRLIQEAKVLSSVHHIGLVSVLDSGVFDGLPYLVMEYISGRPLSKLLEGGPLEPTEVARIGAMVAGALAAIHEQGIVHRDVKPSNLIVDDLGEPHLGDFGIAQLLDATTITIEGTTLGTVSYMAPEQLEDHRVDVNADIWSLGVVLLECLTGRKLYRGTPSEIIAQRLKGPVTLPASLSPSWRAMLGAMVDHRPASRLSAHEVASLLGTEVFLSPKVPSTPLSSGDQETQLSQPTVQTSTQPLGLLPDELQTRTVAFTNLELPPSESKSPWSPSRLGKRSYLWIIGAALAFVVLYALLSMNHRPNSPTTSTSTTKSPTTTQAPSTTTAPTPEALYGNFARDVAAGESAGSLPANLANTLTSQTSQALSAGLSGSLSAASQDFQSAATTLAQGVSGGQITPSEGNTLEADLVALANSFNIASSATTTTAPPTTQPPAPQPPGKGHGKGN